MRKKKTQGLNRRLVVGADIATARFHSVTTWRLLCRGHTRKFPMENLDSFPLFQKEEKKWGASYGSWKCQEMTDILCGLFENKLSAPPAPPNKLRNRQNRNEDYNPCNPFCGCISTFCVGIRRF